MVRKKAFTFMTNEFFEDLENKTILVMGASQGIGRQLATDLAKLKAIPFLSSRNEEKLKELAKDLNTAYCVCDINDDESIKKLVQELPELDGVCVVSGVVKLVPPKMLQRKTIEPQITTNLTSPISLIGHLLKTKKIKDSGSVVFTSAAARLCHPPCTASYAAAKMGLLGLTRSLVADVSFSNKIRFNVASFDYVESEMSKSFEINDADIVAVSPLDYSSFPFLFLISQRSRWINGQIIAADAGRMLGKSRYA